MLTIHRAARRSRRRHSAAHRWPYLPRGNRHPEVGQAVVSAARAGCSSALEVELGQAREQVLAAPPVLVQRGPPTADVADVVARLLLA